MLSRLRVARLIPALFPGALVVGGLYLLLLTSAPLLTSLPIVDRLRTASVTQRLTQPASPDNRLYIPKLGVDIAIVEGKDESALLRGAWHRRPENGNPRVGGNFVLSAHRFSMGLTPEGTIKKSPFYRLQDLTAGDPVVVDYEGRRYHYEVRRKYEVNPLQISIENPTSKSILTLYSCTLRGSADGRDVVEAVPV